MSIKRGRIIFDSFHLDTQSSQLQSEAIAMNKKIFFLLFGVLMTAGIVQAQISYKSGYCPYTTKGFSCTPTCTTDYQCAFNQKCCRNNCGSMSCVSPSAVYSADGGYKGSNKEKEEINKSGYVDCYGRRCKNREKCVRKECVPY